MKTLKKEFLALKSEIDTLITSVKTNKRNHLQNYLYFIYYPVFNFTESIIILCENHKYHSAKILLRSLIEARINITYHQIANSERKLALSGKKAFDEKLKYIKELKDFIRRYPSLKSADSTDLFSDEWLQKAEEWAEKKHKGILKANNLQKTDSDPDLRSKAIECDKACIKNVEKGHFERMYHLIFRQLSLTTHLNIGGLETFVEQDKTGDNFFIEGDNDEYDNLSLIESIEICVAFTKASFECDVFKKNKNISDIICRIEKLIK